MKYRSDFTVVTSRKTGQILYEVWEPYQRLFWPLPWKKIPGSPSFGCYENLLEWFMKTYPGKKLDYSFYGKSTSTD